MRPIIGISSRLSEEKAALYRTNATYVDAIFRAGGLPVQIPMSADMSDAQRYVDMCDGVVITGGPDIAPHLYGEEPCAQVTYARSVCDEFELELIRKAHAAGKPMLNICRGMQLTNVAFGGTLIQDIPSQWPGAICHLQSSDMRDEGTHKVTFTADSFFTAATGATEIRTNTFHHQSVKDLAKGFKVVGKAADGVIEAMESDDGLIWNVQFHPEEHAKVSAQFQKLFNAFIARLK